MAAPGPLCAAGADEIANAVFACYERNVPARKRPRPGEWTMAAAFLLVRDLALPPPPKSASTCHVVSLATGTKCVGNVSKAPRGCAVLDSHAEVLARRGLRRWLTAEAGTALSDAAPSPFVERGPAGIRAVRLRPCWSLHLYVSFPPCGDAAVLVAAGDGSSGGGDCSGALLRTGAHAVGSESRPFTRGLETGSLRTKPGRGSASRSMSCSDKIVRWCALGVQGAALLALFPDPLRLASVVVSAPPPALLASQPGAAPALARASEAEVAEAVRGAAVRALRMRARRALWAAHHPDPGAAAPAVRVALAQFPHAEQFVERAAEPASKGEAKRRANRAKAPAANVSVVYVAGAGVECVIGSNGLLEGRALGKSRKRARAEEEDGKAGTGDGDSGLAAPTPRERGAAPAVSKLHLGRALCGAVGQPVGGVAYSSLKRASSAHAARRAAFLADPAFRDWTGNGPDSDAFLLGAPGE